MSSQELEALLEGVSYADGLILIDQVQFTGPVITHFAQGKPNAFEVPPKPKRIQIAKGLDKRARRPHS